MTTHTAEPRDTGSAGPAGSAGASGSAVTGGGPRRFISEVSVELSKVTWPSAADVRRYTAIVLAFVVLMATFVGLADTGLGFLVGKVYG